VWGLDCVTATESSSSQSVFFCLDIIRIELFFCIDISRIDLPQQCLGLVIVSAKEQE